MYKFQNRNNNSFTLIELLVVLALVAILSVVVVMTLNPAELLKQARDSNRLSDISTINTSLSLFSSDVINGFTGTSTVVYVSVPDNTSSICNSLGLPILPAGYTYNCVTSQNLRNTDGTGWIPVNFGLVSSGRPLSQLPVDPQNSTSTNSYYTYMTGGSWKLTAVSLESQKYMGKGNEDGGIAPGSFEMGNNLSLGAGIFPNGWVKVPGSAIFGTSDFWVMKYEAKCASSTTPGVGLMSPSTAYQTYSNSATSCTGARTITSIPDGYPIANIIQATSSAYCQSIGAHLITNNEWQTIAWNAQGVATNWSNGAVGSGYVYSGQNNTTPNYALQASANDLDGYYGTGQSTGNKKRTLSLSNGQIIWDMSANMCEFTNDSIIGANEPYSAVAGWGWREYNVITNWGTMTQQTIGPVNSSWTSSNGVGRIYTWDGSANSTSYIFLRGGSWTGGMGSGIEALVLNQLSTIQDNSFGFRCVR